LTIVSIIPGYEWEW